MDEKTFSEELDIDFKTTKDLTVSRLLIDQVIGQDRGVSVIRKAAAKKRNVLLIGPPGTGKSLLGQAMSQLIPKEQMEDILAIPNRKDPNTPKIVVVPAGSGEQIVQYHLQRANKSKGLRNFISIILPTIIIILAFMTGQWLMGIFVATVFWRPCICMSIFIAITYLILITVTDRALFARALTTNTFFTLVLSLSLGLVLGSIITRARCDNNTCDGDYQKGR